jgi:hypothetical protein
MRLYSLPTIFTSWMYICFTLLMSMSLTTTYLCSELCLHGHTTFTDDGKLLLVSERDGTET